ncbi:ImmA/IrrE family metallo-endopeptidase [Ligilactobacillus agilis]|uniref:ImmA/IrrE family metallo-endopeptidase n=2 Tax=Ligilactobacillus agilis TaxID=1601 RepID=UPI00242DD522|nr:ImmA/IrrE family metallo-endopeptidase [Ligilactobacillus agilis]
MNFLNGLVNQIKVDVFYYSPMPVKGLYLPSYNVIFIDSSLNDNEQEQVLRHELLHCIEHRHSIGLYTATEAERLKMEAEANDFMLRETLMDYVTTNNIDVSEINPVVFLETQGLSLNFEARIKDIIKKEAGIQ